MSLVSGTEEPVAEDRERALSLHAMPGYSDAFVAQLREAEFGTEGLRYRRLHLEDQLARLSNATFFELRQRQQLIGTYAVAERDLTPGNDPVTGLYRGLLTLAPQAQGRGFGRYLVEQAFCWLQDRAGASPTLSWGCIEDANSRSLSLLRSLGATSLGTLESRLVYRQWPAERVAIHALGSDDSAQLDAGLAEAQSDCWLQASRYTTNDYFATTDGNGIVTGARAQMTAISMTASGGRFDLFYDRVLRRIPAARKRFDPRNFRYLRLSDVIARPGRESDWLMFLPTLLRRHDVHMAMFLLDPRSAVYSALAKAGLFGRFSDSTRQTIHVVARSWNTAADFHERLAGAPMAIGPLDI